MKTFTTKRNKKEIKRNVILYGTVILVMAVLLVFILDASIEKEALWKPQYERLNLGTIINKEILEEEDYNTLLKQTGLGKDAVDVLMGRYEFPDKEKIFSQYQSNFFDPIHYECKRIGIITHEERLRDEKGELIKAFHIPSLKKGDILITKATHSLGWRHGHAAVITDSNKRQSLEAILLGQNSIIQSVDKWQTYPSFLILRLKTFDEELANKIADFSLNTLNDVPYGLFTGIPYKSSDVINQTQCAHLVWYSYFNFGYDIDSDGSWLVTPKDIANSPFLEVVQVYGMNPEDPW